MEFGYARIVRCPHCGGLHSSDFPKISKGKGLDVALWTDGIKTGFMINCPGRPFYYCTYTGCEKTFWFDDAEVVHVISDLNINSNMPADQKKALSLHCELSKGVNYTGLDNCYQAIEEGIAGENFEKWKRLRKFTWMETVDPLRALSDCNFVIGSCYALSKRHITNLMELRKLMDISIEEERLESIEIHRQSGEFKEAGNLLGYEWSNHSIELVDFQKELISQKDMMLRRISL